MLPIGVALSGGTARSVTHVGVLKALVEEGLPVDYLAATSGGSIVGTFFASGMPMASLLQLANNLSWSKLVSLKFSRLGFVSSKRIEDFVEDIIGDITFADLKVPSYVIATRLSDGSKRVFDSGSVAKAVRASCSIPQIFLPMEVDGEYYVDGGVSEYMPVNTLQDLGEMFVIGSNLAQRQPMYSRPNNYVQLALHMMGLMSKTNLVKSVARADVVIHPDTDSFSPFGFDDTQRLIDVGYRTTVGMMPEIKRAWKHKSNKLQRIIDKLSPK